MTRAREPPFTAVSRQDISHALSDIWHRCRAGEKMEEVKGMVAHCLFEQSGTFKKEFRKLGIDAYDYDIADDYGQTDFKVDLFTEIHSAYSGGVSIFDNFSEKDFMPIGLSGNT